MSHLAELLQDLDTTQVTVGAQRRLITLRALTAAERIAITKACPAPFEPRPETGEEDVAPEVAAQHAADKGEWYRKHQAAEVWAALQERGPVDAGAAIKGGEELQGKLTIGVIEQMHQALMALDRGEDPARDDRERLVRAMTGLLDVEAGAVEAGKASWLTAGGEPPAEPAVVATILRMLRDEVALRAQEDASPEGRAEKNSSAPTSPRSVRPGNHPTGTPRSRPSASSASPSAGARTPSSGGKV